MFSIDIETCRACGGPVKIIACIENPVVIKQILSRPASVPLCLTFASSALAAQHYLKWLDGVSDALAYDLRLLGS